MIGRNGLFAMLRVTRRYRSDHWGSLVLALLEFGDSCARDSVFPALKLVSPELSVGDPSPNRIGRAFESTRYLLNAQVDVDSLFWSRYGFTKNVQKNVSIEGHSGSWRQPSKGF